MNSDQLQRWALVAEIVGGVAVVLSLIFVGFQVRQSADETALNTVAIEVAAYQDLVGQITGLNEMLISARPWPAKPLNYNDILFIGNKKSSWIWYV